MLGTYCNSRFHKQAVICDLHVQGAKVVILQEDPQKLLAASAGSWAWAVESCVWHLLHFFSQVPTLGRSFASIGGISEGCFGYK